MKKRILSLLLAAVMVCALLPTMALAVTVTEVVPCTLEYSWVGRFYEGFAQVAVFKNGSPSQYGFIDKTGNEIVPLGKYDDVKDFSDGLAAVGVVADHCYEWGFIDKTGKEVIPLKYNYVGSFSEGLAEVAIQNGFGDDLVRRCGFIDKSGNEIVPCKYVSVHGFSEGLAAVCMEEGYSHKWGFIDKTGKEVIPCEYENVGKFSEGLAAVKLNGKWGVIDKTGNEVVPCTLDYYEVKDFSGGFAMVEVGNWITGKWGFIDKTGNEVVPCEYDKIDPDYFCEGLAWVGQNGKYGFVDTTGKEVIPLKYDSVGNFSEGLAPVELNGKYCFIDKTGKEVIPCKYDEAYVFNQGLARVRLNGKYGYIDKTGKEVVPYKYDDAAYRFSEGLAAVELNGKYGLLAIDGYADTSAPAAPTTYTGQPTNDKLSVDGQPKAPTAYKINGSNYFQLRDVALLLNGTKAQFSVDYDSVRKAVIITTGQSYTPNGSEGKAAAGAVEAIVGNNDVYINGEKVDFTVYKINGSNYFKIRDLGRALGFNVGWTAERGMFIESDKLYDPAN